MLSIASLAVNSLFTCFLGYHFLKYGKGEVVLVIVGLGYALVVAVCALTLLGFSLL